MNLTLEKRISEKTLLRKIHSYNISNEDLIQNLSIKESTLRKYSKSNAKNHIRSSPQRQQLFLLEYALRLAKENGLTPSLRLLKEIYCEGETLLKLIITCSSEVTLILLISERIKRVAEEKNNFKSPSEEFRARYEYINDETLETASINSPDLLVKLIDDTSLRPITRAKAIESLAIGARSQYFDYIKEFATNSSPFIREASFNAMYEYFDSDSKYFFLIEEFEKFRNEEMAEGVISTILERINDMCAA